MSTVGLYIVFRQYFPDNAMNEDVQLTINQGIEAIGIAIEIFGVAVIVIGIVWSTYTYLQPRVHGNRYEAYRRRIGRSLLLGLEILVAADIVRTVALELTFASLGTLALLVLIRTFLAWALEVEINGRWPWQDASLNKEG